MTGSYKTESSFFLLMILYLTLVKSLADIDRYYSSIGVPGGCLGVPKELKIDWKRILGVMTGSYLAHSCLRLYYCGVQMYFLSHISAENQSNIKKYMTVGKEILCSSKLHQLRLSSLFRLKPRWRSRLWEIVNSDIYNIYVSHISAEQQYI